MQLPLPVTLPTDETFESFVAGKNGEVVALIQSLAQAMPLWRKQSELRHIHQLKAPIIHLFGGAGTGKSHLLYALSHILSAQGQSHVYLNLADHTSWSPAVFDGLEYLPLICLDNIHVLAGKADWEEALFDLINRVSETQQSLLVITSRLGALHPDFILPDLRSRLGWGLSYQLVPLSDEDKQTVVEHRVTQRGLNLSQQALQFLLHHSDRDMPSLMALIERLDQRSLQEKKRLTVNLVKRELGLE